MAGPKAITTPNIPIAVPRRSTGNMSMSTVITIGIRIPAPAACAKRPISKRGKFGAKPQSKLPKAKMLMETINRERVVKRSIKKAVIGIMIAFTRVKPVVSHCAVAASMPISAMMGGSAGVTTVWLSTVTKAPRIRIMSVTFCLLVKPQPMCDLSFCALRQLFCK